MIRKEDTKPTPIVIHLCFNLGSFKAFRTFLSLEFTADLPGPLALPAPLLWIQIQPDEFSDLIITFSEIVRPCFIILSTVSLPVPLFLPNFPLHLTSSFLSSLLYAFYYHLHVLFLMSGTKRRAFYLLVQGSTSSLSAVPTSAMFFFFFYLEQSSSKGLRACPVSEG